MSQIWDTSYSVPVTLTTFAVLTAAASLIIRRRTWHVPGEIAVSTAVLLLAVATFLSSDEIDAVGVGDVLWHATGFGYLDNFAGQMCYVAGTLALLQGALYRLADEAERREIVEAFVRWPLTLLVPLMLSAMYMSPALHDEPCSPAFDVMSHGSDVWTLTYRALYLACLLYLTLLLMHVLRTVRRTGGRGYCLFTTMYLCCCGLSLSTTALRVVEMITPGHPALDAIPVYTRAAFSTLVAVTAALSWLCKMWGYRRLLLHTRTSRRQLRRDTMQSHRQRLALAAPVASEARDGDEPDQLTPAKGPI
ncbi:hypothetical protein SEA_SHEDLOCKHOLMES_45 [Mycobacterium phage ShedlockHolmes]|uniref:Uncharacterized protein n=1 Tax=Mycobacterium phage ShedlockHolmes TaxID=1647313 RepID=A0A0F6SK24_9CAUD|nr:hypothetical protein SEA_SHEDLOCKHOLMES_45 [Mycobacterium phage ShedlockHolmes]AKF15222.1 hypothetical protein SEA_SHEDLOCKHOLMES_45 [Mycobacterium phage ShedlockHolmes]